MGDGWRNDLRELLVGVEQKHLEAKSHCAQVQFLQVSHVATCAHSHGEHSVTGEGRLFKPDLVKYRQTVTHKQRHN